MAKADRQNAALADISFGATSVTVSAPTVAEVTALTRIECGIVAGSSVDASRTSTTIDITGLCDKSTASIAGRRNNEDIEITLYREFDGTDAFWALFDDQTDPPPTQYLVIARNGYTAGTPTAADVVDVYTVEVGSRSPMLTDEESQRFTVTLHVKDDPNFDVSIVA